MDREKSISCTDNPRKISFTPRAGRVVVKTGEMIMQLERKPLMSGCGGVTEDIASPHNCGCGGRGNTSFTQIASVPAYGSSESSPRTRARVTAWMRVCTPSFEKILLTWRLTVLIERTRAWAIS